MKKAAILHVRGISQDMEQTLRAGDICSSVALVASKRLYETLTGFTAGAQLPPLIPIVPLEKSFQAIDKALEEGDVTLLASGDPLFFGIGRRLMEAFPGREIRFHPALSSMQLCFARFAIPWDDARFVSVHGRRPKNITMELLNFPKVFVFTDPIHSPDTIAATILQECSEKMIAGTRVYVAENLGGTEERLFNGTLRETAARQFADPNVMILLNKNQKDGMEFSFGLQEKEIKHSRGLITKNEVRAAVLHSLRLPGCGMLWDVGAGSGSVGLEAARLVADLQVLAIEKEEEQWQNIEANRNYFRAWNLELVKGAAPQALYDLAAPDRVFVGGSGGNLQKILAFSAKALSPGGIIVVNAVLAKTARLAPEILHRLGLHVEIKEIAVTRYEYLQGSKKKFNPISIVVGTKEKQESACE